jgi:hypothetical protein
MIVNGIDEPLSAALSVFISGWKVIRCWRGELLVRWEQKGDQL